ncbi:MAG: 1-deoxy-D-xylulose-5-phosphate synthase N-terminal domain-containing protein [Collinsella sp.]
MEHISMASDKTFCPTSWRITAPPSHIKRQNVRDCLVQLCRPRSAGARFAWSNPQRCCLRKRQRPRTSRLSTRRASAALRRDPSGNPQLRRRRRARCPNLGVVELTVALHRVFNSPSTRFL